MSKKLLHTPEGVRDLYYNECAKKLAIQDKIHKSIKLYGYRDIQTPTFEFFDIFNKERGTVESKEMYKFFDREGNTLVLRPDITPSIARCVSKYFMEEDMPIRLCYEGNTFINNSSYQGRLKENTQLGAELIGDETSDGDAELIAMTIHSLLEAGLTKFQVEIGHIGFFNGLMEEACLDEEDEELLKELIENKNYFGVDELLREKDLNPKLKEVILKLPQFFGQKEQLQIAKSMTKNPTSLQAIERLEKVYDILVSYGLEKYITFDMGMLGKYKYYTGIIFKAYTYGTGDSIVTGGRYDRLMTQFGKKAAAVGFVILLDSLMMSLARQKIDVKTDIMSTILLYERAQKALAIKTAEQLRSKGYSIQLMKKYHEKSIENYIEFAKKSYIEKILYIDESGRNIQVTDVKTGKKEISDFKKYLKV